MINMGKSAKKDTAQKTNKKLKKAGEKPASPVNKVDFLLHLNKLQGTLLYQLRKEI
jgi:hypothetical protein